MPSDICVPGMALPPGAHASPCETQGPPGAGDRHMNMHAESMLSDMFMAALAPTLHFCTDQQNIMSVGIAHASSDFLEAVARFL